VLNKSTPTMRQPKLDPTWERSVTKRTDIGAVTTEVTPTKDGSVTDSGGSVVLRGVVISLNTEIGQAFIADCARFVEGLLRDHEIQQKWGLTQGDWEGLAQNAPLQKLVCAERDRRIASSEGAREAAQRQFLRAPNILGEILTNQDVSPRHRIEAARELRAVASAGGDVSGRANERFTVVIKIGTDEKLNLEREFHREQPVGGSQ
jgi:hypothetical protein